MVSDSDMGTEGGAGMEEESQESSMGMTGSSYAAEPDTGAKAGEETPTEEAKPKTTRGGGRRAALKIIRQHVESVSRELEGFRKSHDASSKRLEKQVSSLRNDLNALKSYLSKENAKARSKADASFTRVLSKLNTPKPKARKAAGTKKKAGKSRSKGKK